MKEKDPDAVFLPDGNIYFHGSDSDFYSAESYDLEEDCGYEVVKKDENIIDESNAKISEFTLYLSNQLTKVQNGHLQSYGLVFFVALTLLMIVFFVTNLNTGDAWTNLIQRLNSEIF